MTDGSLDKSAMKGGTTYRRQGSGLNTPFLSRLRTRMSLRWKGARFRVFEENSDLEDAQRVVLDSMSMPKDKRFFVGLVKDGAYPPYYSKYRRFLETNRIPYEYYDIHSSRWLEGLDRFSFVIWTPMGSPSELDEAREKIFIIEKYCGKLAYPTFDEVMFYENKLIQYDLFRQMGLPIVDTFVSSDRDETLEWIQKCEYPIVSKLKAGSGSLGVTLLRSRTQAKRIVDRIFGRGNPTYWQSIRQKNYVFFQRYIENHGFDLRVIVIDENNVFGYFRTTPKGDFRASGRGDVVKTGLPKEAVRIAVEATKRLKFTNLSVDFLQSSADDRFYIIEASNFIQIETPRQLEIEGTPGRYRYDSRTDQLVFEEGKYWVQELALKRYFEMHFGPTADIHR